MTNRPRDSWFVIAILGMVLCFGHEIVWGGKIPFFRDLGTYFYPMRFSLAMSFKNGELPLWDRHVAMGFPLLADFQSAVFYPPHVLYLLLPFVSALGTIFLFHYTVGATGAYVLCRHWRCSPQVATLGAVLFTFGGITVSLTNLLNHFQTAVWLPWVIFFGEKCLTVRSWRSFLGLVAVLLVQFLAGSPEFYVMSLVILALDGIRLKEEGPQNYWRHFLFLFGAANVLVVALAMVQILPTIELISESRARRFLAFSEATSWSLNPWQLINLFFPDREVDLSVLPPLRLFLLTKVPFFVTYYVGAVAPLGVFWWLYYSSRKEKFFLLLLLTVSLLLALGDYTPIYSVLLQHVPLFRLFRFPEKFFFITYALILFVILKGISRCVDSEKSDRSSVVIAVSVFLLFFFLYLYFSFETSSLTRFLTWATKKPGLGAQGSPFVLARLEIQLLLTFILFSLLLARRHKLLGTSLFKALLIAVVFVDLNAVNGGLQYLIKPEFLTKSGLVLDAPDQDHARVFYIPGGSNVHPSEYYFYRQVSFSEFNALVFKNLLPNSGVLYGFDYMQEIDALSRWPYSIFLSFANSVPPETLFRLLGNLNVKYIVGFKPIKTDGVLLVRDFSEYSSWLYRNPVVSPRAYLVNRTTAEVDPFKVLARLSSNDYKHSEEVVLEKPIEIEARQQFNGNAQILEYKNQTVTIHAVCNGAAILVLADSYYPGWRVYVNGAEREILRTNLFFRGVKLESGDHRVEFRYQPRSFTIGLFVTLTALGGLIATSVILYYRKKLKITD